MFILAQGFRGFCAVCAIAMPVLAGALQKHMIDKI